MRATDCWVSCAARAGRLTAAAMDENRACPAKLGFPWCERARYSD
jgi:hypothetical protein